MLLFEDDVPSAPDPSTRLYAIVIHSHSSLIKVPDFIDVIFPDEKCKNVLAVIPLLDKFPQVRQIDVEIEEIKDALKLAGVDIQLTRKNA